jgi:hypothetical protein
LATIVVTTNSGTNDTTANATNTTEDKETSEEQVSIEAYTTNFISSNCQSSLEIDSITKERNTAYYHWDLIYKEKFKEYDLATAKLEKLLMNNPEEKLVVPTLYNYINLPNHRCFKSNRFKEKITTQF